MSKLIDNYEPRRRQHSNHNLPPLASQRDVDWAARLERWGAIARDWTAALAQLALFLTFLFICALLVDALTHTPGPM